MARVTDFFVKGIAEHIVLYRRMGKNCSRVKRSNIKQTPATVMRGINFGIAARAGKGLRQGLQDVMPEPTNRSMQSRFSGAIAWWLGVSEAGTLPSLETLPFVSVFNFSTHAVLSERCKVPFSVNHPREHLLTIHINAFAPAARISAPAGTQSVEIIFSVAGCLLQSGEVTGSHTISLSYPYNHMAVPAQVLSFPVPMPPGSITVTAARIIYTGLKNNQLTIIGDPAFTPAGIVDARYVDLDH
jgi:hypothetical protein